MTPSLPGVRFWLVTVAALLVAAVTFSLGQWQLRRAAQKVALQAAVDLRAEQAVLDAKGLSSFKNVVDAIHRPAALRGVWRAEHTLFLDNRPMKNKSGFVVLTPLALEGTAQVILVQRGWVQRDFTDRSRVPEVQTPAGTVTVMGRIAPPPSKLYEFKGVEKGRIRQNVDMTSLAGELALPLLQVSLLQTGVASDGLLRDWAAPNLGVDKHYGYAFQWFGLCALVVLLYAWFQVITPWRTQGRAGKQSRNPLSKF